MKFSLNKLCLFGLMLLLSQVGKAQAVGSGRIEARFSIDGDLTSDTALFGNVVGGKPSDDWFKMRFSGSGIGVIDTLGSYAYKKLMQSSSTARDTLAFFMPMAVPKLTRSGGFILIDALYAKDYFDADKTMITSGSKSVDDPNTWTIASGTPQSKDEIMEFYSHVRRKGQTVWDSLFFYFGVGIHGTTGNKNVAAELFVNDVQLNAATGKLTNLGNDGGRVAWLFDPAGNVTRVGDMVFSMSYSSGSFSIDPRIWVHDTSRQTGPGAITPVNFDWGTKFDKQAGTDFGFADIIPINGSTFAQGVANSTDTTSAAPWGTIESAASHNWQTHYDPNQFIEMSVNLTGLGVDPSLFTNLDPCTVPYRTIVFRSRAASSFNSDLADFAGPYPFWRYPRVISSIKGNDTLTCTKTSGSVFADSAYSLAWYRWTATNGGNITGYNLDSTEMHFNRPGDYILESAPLRGCYTQKDTITILEDALHPIASAEAYDSLIMGSVYAVKLYGGDSAASVAATNSLNFGASKGIRFYWTGPSGYTANIMQPMATEMGNYFLTVTELRNGCTDTVSTWLALLPVHLGDLQCSSTGSAVQLKWEAFSESGVHHYQLERMNINGRKTIANLEPKYLNDGTAEYVFKDGTPERGFNYYSVKAISGSGAILAETSCGSRINEGLDNVRIYPVPAGSVLYVALDGTDGAVTYEVINVTGKKVLTGTFETAATTNSILLDGLPSGSYTLKLLGNNTAESIGFIH